MMLTSLCFLLVLICSIDRSAISVAILPMSADYGWSSAVKGEVSSMFFLGYCLTNAAGGYLSTQFSTKAVVSWGVVLWSIWTLLTPAAAASASLPALLAVRLFMGASEGVTLPCVQTLVSRHVPANRRSRVLSLIYSALQLGSITALLTAPRILDAFGWEDIFFIYGALGFGWLLLWAPLALDGAPLVAEEVDGGGDGDAVAAAASPPLGETLAQFANSRVFYGVAGAQMAQNFAAAVLSSWLPTFYNTQYGLNVADSATLTLLPFVCQAITTNVAGWLADEAINSGQDRRNVRRAAQSVAAFGPAFLLLSLGLVPQDALQATGTICATFALSGCSTAGVLSSHQDTASPRTVGLLFGVTNTLSALAGFSAVSIVGYMLETDAGSGAGWTNVFLLAAFVHALGGAVYVNTPRLTQKVFP